MNGMMKKVWVLALLFPMLAVAQSNNYKNDPIIQAVLASYAEQIQANPQDYFAYYCRAKDYFQYGEYDLALADLNEAIKYFPDREPEELSQAHAVRAMIYESKEMNDLALQDYNRAYELAPNQHLLLRRANLLCATGNYTAAKNDYQQVLRVDMRCQDAYVGMAKIAHYENNAGLRDEYLVKGEKSNPYNGGFYVKRAELYNEICLKAQAAKDYVKAIALSSDIGIVYSLFSLSYEAYDEVVEALSEVIASGENVEYNYLLRAMVHQNNQRYTAAIKDWNTIVEKGYNATSSVNYNRAYCYMRVGQFEYAMIGINEAISKKPTELSYYIFRSRLYRLMGDFESATADLSMAAIYNPSDVDVLMHKGLMAAEQGDYETAKSMYGEAILYYADNSILYLLRAAACEKLGDTEGAAANYEMVVRIYNEDSPLKSWYGFALAYLGQSAEAEAWIEKLLSADNGKVLAEDYYYAACLYALTGNKDMAYNRLEEALKAGYGDYFNIFMEYDYPMTLAPLRNDAEFSNLMQEYSEVF